MTDKVENAFLTCLKEIEVKYTVLSKPLRLRVEKWIEKLIIVGKNGVWKKDRNMYARLLLSMVLARSLTDPFDTSPPDGPLPPFPSYLRSKLKNVAGPHESFFWRDVYDRLAPSSTDEVIPPPKTYLDMSSTITLDPENKETYNLRQLIAEQARRIEILEQQMNEERLHHEEEIQRFLRHHKSEVERLRQAYNRQSDRADHRHTAPRQHINRSYDSFMNSKSITANTPLVLPAEAGRDGSGSFLRRSFDTTRTPFAIPPSHTSPGISASTSHHYSEKKENFDSNMFLSNHTKDASAHDRGDSPGDESSSPSCFAAETSPPSNLSRTALNTPHTDIAPSIPKPTSSADISPRSTLHRSEMGSGTSRPPSSVKFDIRPRPSPPVIAHELDNTYDTGSLNETRGNSSMQKQSSLSDSGDIFSRDVPDDDNEFMSYLEDFQTEIRNMQFNLPKVP